MIDEQVENKLMMDKDCISFTSFCFSSYAYAGILCAFTEISRAGLSLYPVRYILCCFLDIRFLLLLGQKIHKINTNKSVCRDNVLIKIPIKFKNLLFHGTFLSLCSA